MVSAAVKNRFRRKARPPNRGGFEVRYVLWLLSTEGKGFKTTLQICSYGRCCI